MAATDAPPPADHEPRWPAFLGNLSGRSVALALLFGSVVAVLLNPVVATPFSALLARVLFLSMLLLLAFTAAGYWQQQRPLPRRLVQLLAVLLVSTLALAVYLLSTDGDAFFGSDARLVGLAWIAGTATVLGLLLALGALYRERDAQARSQQLHFELERQRLQRQAADARLALLRSQIEPHFLFNTLANVQALVETGSPRASAVLGSLIAYLRAAVPRLQDRQATLVQELELVRAYLELMQLRMPDRLRFAVTADADAIELRFPPMALLTLVENAVRHGIDPSEAGGHIDVRVRRDGASAARHLSVCDSGVGMADHAAAGTGLDNLRERLQSFFDPPGRLTLSPVMPHGLCAHIVVPPQRGAP